MDILLKSFQNFRYIEGFWHILKKSASDLWRHWEVLLVFGGKIWIHSKHQVAIYQVDMFLSFYAPNGEKVLVDPMVWLNGFLGMKRPKINFPRFTSYPFKVWLEKYPDSLPLPIYTHKWKTILPYRTIFRRIKFSPDKIYSRIKFSAPIQNFGTFVHRNFVR